VIVRHVVVRRRMMFHVDVPIVFGLGVKLGCVLDPDRDGVN
jgi:hypothetical protein